MHRLDTLALESLRQNNRHYYLRAYTDFAFKKERRPSFPSETPKPEARRPPHGKRGDTTLHAFTYPVPTCILRKSDTAISSSLEYTEAVRPYFVSFTRSIASSSSSTTMTATAGPNVSSRVNATLARNREARRRLRWSRVIRWRSVAFVTVALIHDLRTELYSFGDLRRDPTRRRDVHQRPERGVG